MEESKPVFVYADVESESLKAIHLLQIASITENGEQDFSIYINPFQNLGPHCKTITGLYFDNTNLCKDGKILPSVPIKEALIAFKNWLATLNTPVYLVFHNAFGFDIRVLLKHYREQKIEFPENVIFVCDTLPAFRKFMKTPPPDCKLGTLAAFTGVPLIEAHNAIDDAKCLREICKAFTTSEGISLIQFHASYQKPLSFFQKKLK